MTNAQPTRRVAVYGLSVQNERKSDGPRIGHVRVVSQLQHIILFSFLVKIDALIEVNNPALTSLLLDPFRPSPPHSRPPCFSNGDRSSSISSINQPQCTTILISSSSSSASAAPPIPAEQGERLPAPGLHHRRGLLRLLAGLLAADAPPNLLGHARLGGL